MHSLPTLLHQSPSVVYFRPSLSLALVPVDILDVLALVPFGRKRLAAVLAREPPVRSVLIVLVLTPGADILEELGTRIASVVALGAPAKVVVQPNRREVPASQTSAAATAIPLQPCTSTQPGKEANRGMGKKKKLHFHNHLYKVATHNASAITLMVYCHWIRLKASLTLCNGFEISQSQSYASMALQKALKKRWSSNWSICVL